MPDWTLGADSSYGRQRRQLPHELIGVADMFEGGWSVNASRRTSPQGVPRRGRVEQQPSRRRICYGSLCALPVATLLTSGNDVFVQCVVSSSRPKVKQRSKRHIRQRTDIQQLEKAIGDGRLPGRWRRRGLYLGSSRSCPFVTRALVVRLSSAGGLRSPSHFAACHRRPSREFGTRSSWKLHTEEVFLPCSWTLHNMWMTFTSETSGSPTSCDDELAKTNTLNVDHPT